MKTKSLLITLIIISGLVLLLAGVRYTGLLERARNNAQRDQNNEDHLHLETNEQDEPEHDESDEHADEDGHRDNSRDLLQYPEDEHGRGECHRRAENRV